MNHKLCQMTFVLITVLLSLKTSAIDKKFIDGSEIVTPNAEATKFMSDFSKALQAKSEAALVALLEPESFACYKKSKFPEAYKTEFGRMLGHKIISVKEFRKFTQTFEFHKLMSYPKAPTHLAVFNSESLVGSRMGTGYISIEIVEINGHYFLAYRCI